MKKRNYEGKYTRDAVIVATLVAMTPFLVMLIAPPWVRPRDFLLTLLVILPLQAVTTEFVLASARLFRIYR